MKLKTEKDETEKRDSECEKSNKWRDYKEKQEYRERSGDTEIRRKVVKEREKS